MARKTKEGAELTRTRILASALTLFARRGYEHVTFTDIAARLKLTKGAVYWHFRTKEELLLALVRLAQERFRAQLDGALSAGELTYPSVAEMMVQVAERLVADARATAFFLLMKCRIPWTDAALAGMRDSLSGAFSFGPREAFRQAVANDAAAGRVRADVSADEVAAASIAVWDGLVQARIDGFLNCDLARALRLAYGGLWRTLQG